MIRAAHIARFRGLRDCMVDGFGRVNLIIGRNNCGKTAFMEALRLAEDAQDAAHYLLRDQRMRLGRGVKRHDFERYWQPIFFDLDAKAGLSISTIHDDGVGKRLEVRQGAVSEEIISDKRNGRNAPDDDELETEDFGKPPAWALDLEITTWARGLIDLRLAPPPGGIKLQQRVVSMPGGMRIPPVSSTGGEGGYWVGSSPGIGEIEVSFVSALKQRGQETSLVELLREVDRRLTGIELLAPGGDVAELFVRLDNGTPMLPVRLMGEGFQHCLEIGAGAAVHDWPNLFIDEIENGMHHLVLEPLWRWIASTARRRNLQVFATTHSEECIQAACRAFQGLDDDGLRVIRLDRLESETRAIIYDRALIEVAERTGTEIRG
jgi:AAA domain, putative AbiEii toxin, Type IV TA system